MTFAISIHNDTPYPDELWGPYKTKKLAAEVMVAFVGVPESAAVIPVQGDMTFTGRPE